MEYIIGKEFLKSKDNLKKYGGAYTRAANKLDEVIGKIAVKKISDEDYLSDLPRTTNGEQRINKCIKYQLPGRSRLVTVRHEDRILLLYLGNHGDTDSWLDKNIGTDFTNINRQQQITPVRRRSQQSNSYATSLTRSFSAEDTLTRRVSSNILMEIIKPLEPIVLAELYDLKLSDSDDKFLEVCLKIDDSNLQNTWLDVLSSLAEDDEANVKKLVDIYIGLIKPMSADINLTDSTEFQRIPTNSPEWAKLYKHFAQTADFKDWMLFLHPEQKFVVEQHHTGSSKLLGVSGSGKTCVAIKRAIYLAELYPSDKILLLTLNKSLAQLIQDLVLSAAPEDVTCRISVMPFFEICQQLIYEFEPGSERFYSDMTWKSDEHIDEIWREYYQCQLNFATAEVLHPVHDSLISQGIDADAYIRAEFDWIRSAIPGERRQDYLEMDRTGRSVRMPHQFRELLLAGLVGWEAKMRAIGVIDSLGIVAALQPHIDKIEPLFRSILVDESQDFGTSELAIIRRLVAPSANDLFLCGDAAQKVQIKYQKLKEAQITIPKSAHSKLIKNYRNSFEVLHAAHDILTKHMTEELLDNENFEILDPEYADFHGSTPLILQASSLEEEIAYAVHYINEELSHHSTWKACIAIAGYSLYEIQTFGSQIGLPVLDGTIGIEDQNLYFSDLAQSKGFEFDIMLVINLSAGVMPNALAPESEHFNDLATLYVAMTRAKTQLILSYHGEISSLLVDIDEEFFLLDNWANYGEKPSDFKLISPIPLNEITSEENVVASVAEMTGMEFLYTNYAIGLSIELISRLRDKVGYDSNQHSTRDMGWIYHNVKKEPREYNSFGRDMSKQLLELGEPMGLEALHGARLDK
tara:strand:+ start:4561 stop:7143 length:2583 start_codon:yes stop_codon:yes gene_type:complete